MSKIVRVDFAKIVIDDFYKNYKNLQEIDDKILRTPKCLLHLLVQSVNPLRTHFYDNPTLHLAARVFKSALGDIAMIFFMDTRPYDFMSLSWYKLEQPYAAVGSGKRFILGIQMV